MSAAQMGAYAMANQSRKKGGKRAFGKTLIRLFFVLMLLSMLAAYISNQVTISSKRAELETLNEQIAQQQTENRRCSASSAATRTRSPSGSHATLTTMPRPTSAFLWT